MKYQLIVPPSFETEITGLALGAEKIIGKTLWRLEFYRGHKVLCLYKDGVLVTEFDNLPKMVGKFAADFFKFTRQFDKEIAA
jgi:hypothetical protein